MTTPTVPILVDGRPLPCRLCDAPATGIVYAPLGCACAPDPVQALCPQHLLSAEPIRGMWMVYPSGGNP